jgi:glycyl-tRNA synthetase beta chain
MPEFFIELFSEEIPARMQQLAARQLATLTTGYLQDITLRGTPVREYYGPRRIAVAFEVQPKVYAVGSEQRGPRSNAPDSAIDGFLRKNNATRENLRVEDGYFILSTQTPERSAREVILEKLPQHLAKLPWPKSMRWGQGGEFTWVRPLRRVVCLLDGEVVPVTLGPVTAGNETEGHRVHAPGAFAVSSAAEWVEALRAHYVIADQDERRGVIAEGIAGKAAALGLSVAEDSGLLDEVTGLVEWPVPLIGRIDEKFMDLPPEVRELSMKINQKYFALRDADGKPAPYFAFVANLAAEDDGRAIIAGNERVLRARLSDARHFWDLDLKTPLDALLPKLEKITFHAKIGTQRQRADRIADLAKQIAEVIGASRDEIIQAGWAGLLAKADLVTGMVGEFPELQGVIGGYYAEKSPHGWDGSVVGPAIKTHYQPKGPSDEVPTSTVAMAVAVADKLDTLREFFANGEKPTGSGDPYALRRCALGVIRIILENELRLPLFLLSGDQGVFDFIIERLRVLMRGEGKRDDVLKAVLATGLIEHLVGLVKRAEALSEMLGTENGIKLHAAYKRAANILKIEDPDNTIANVSPIPALLIEAAEKHLYKAMNEVCGKMIDDQSLQNERYVEAMTHLASLSPVVDGFFRQVTVVVEESDLRRNRLRLLAGFRDTVHHIADFSKLEG